ncbi:MAG: (2Fe-2S)-binding protein [Hyphomicrobium sp.]|nr:(2Fe-2S)-binding protein [Hyphomicrobium sp.]
MIVCSCAIISDKDLERAVLEIMSQPNAPLPTPGVVYRHLQKTMQCCGCAPLAAETIYAKMEALEKQGQICPCACATAKTRLKDITERPARRPSAPSRGVRIVHRHRRQGDASGKPDAKTAKL